MRYALVNLLYKLRVPSGFVTSTDFRPHFEGHLLNVCTIIPVGLNPDRIEAALASKLRQSFTWMCKLRFLLRDGDKVQFCLGTLNPRQQYLVAWSFREDL